MKTWKTNIVVEGRTAKLLIYELQSDTFTSNLRALEDLTVADIDVLMKRLEEEKAVIQKLEAALK